MDGSGHVVDQPGDLVQIGLGVVEGTAFGEPASQDAVVVFDGGPLPGGVGIAQVDRGSGDGLDIGPIFHLPSLVPGQGASHRRGGHAEHPANLGKAWPTESHFARDL